MPAALQSANLQRNLEPVVGAGQDVLIVDDDDEFRQLLAARIEALGAYVSQASSVFEAIDRFEASSADLVISDYSMPQATGLNLLAYLSARGFTGHFVLMSGELSRETASLARSQGADAISKWDLIGYL